MFICLLPGNELLRVIRLSGLRSVLSVMTNVSCGLIECLDEGLTYSFSGSTIFMILFLDESFVNICLDRGNLSLDKILYTKSKPVM